MLQQIVRIDTEALRRILEVSMDTGKATAGGAASLTDTTKEWVVNEFANYAVEITEGTGKGQFRQITANTATVLTVAAWTTVPDATSWYRITPFGIIAGIVFADIQKWGTVVQTGYNITPLFKSITSDEGTATILAVGATLTDTNKNWQTNIFAGYNVRIVEGTGAGQTRKIVSNTGTVLTTAAAWGVQPTTDSKYSIYLAPLTDVIGDVTVVIASGDQPIGRVTVQSHAHLGSGDMPIGRVTIQSSPYIASGDEPIGRVRIIGTNNAVFATVSSTGGHVAFRDGYAMGVCSYPLSSDLKMGNVTILSGDDPIGKVTVQSMANIASGDEPMGRVTIQSQAFLASGNQPIGQVTIASFGGGLSSSDVPIGQVTVRSMVNIASGNEPIGGVRIIGSNNALFATVSSTGDAPAFRDGYAVLVRSYPLSSNLKMGNVTILSGNDPIGKVTVQSMINLASGDESIGKVTIQSMCNIASGDEPMGKVTVMSGNINVTLLSGSISIGDVQIMSNDDPIGKVTVQSFMGGLNSGDQPIGQVTVRSMVNIASGDEPLGRVTIQSMANIASGDEPIGRVTIQSQAFIASGNQPIGQVTIASFGGGLSSSDVPIGQVTVRSMVNIASGNEPIGGVRIIGSNNALFATVSSTGDEPAFRDGYAVLVRSYPLSSNLKMGNVTILSGDDPIGKVTVQSMINLASGDESIGKVTIQSMCNIASGDEPMGRVTIQSQAFIASGNQPIGQVTIASFGGGLSSSDVPIGRVTVQSFMGGLASGDQPIGQVTVRSMVNIASGDEPIGKVTIQSMCNLASGDESIGKVTVQSMCNLASGDQSIGQVTVRSMINLASGDESIGKVTIQSMCSLASGDRPIGQVTIASMPITTISPTWDARTMNFAVIATTLSGDNNIVPLVQSSRIIVRSVVVVASGAVNMKWVSGSSDISGLMPLTVNGGYSAHDPEGILQTGIGEDLIINVNATVPIGGHLGYITRLS